MKYLFCSSIAKLIDFLQNEINYTLPGLFPIFHSLFRLFDHIMVGQRIEGKYYGQVPQMGFDSLQLVAL
tara:strand:- start:130 stop:336 length:207 start_codon:yes stop_codon:yes gene_type:complete